MGKKHGEREGLRLAGAPMRAGGDRNLDTDRHAAVEKPPKSTGKGGAAGAAQPQKPSALGPEKLHKKLAKAAPVFANAEPPASPQARKGALGIWDPRTSNAAVRPVPPRPQPPVSTEYLRMCKVLDLRKLLARLCREQGDREPPPLAFERWLIRSKLQEAAAVAAREPAADGAAPQQPQPSGGAEAAAAKKKKKKKKKGLGASEPVLPRAAAQPSSLAQSGLAVDLARVAIGHDAAAAIAAKLAAESARLAAQVASQAAEERRKQAGEAGPPAAAAGGGAPQQQEVLIEVHKHSLDVALSGHEQKILKINPGHFQKLKELFRRYGDGGGGGGSPDGDDPSGDVAAAVAAAPPRFREALFRVLARYHAIGAYGFQAALNEETFEVLRTRRAETGPRGDNRLGVAMECFASPLNCRFAPFCSAFPDTDAPFGSAGSFLDFKPDSGSFEANPPFESELFLAAVRHAEALLSRGGEKGSKQQPLSFAFVCPGWEDMEAWVAMESSPFLTRKIVIAKADHGFADGTASYRDRFRESPFDTAFFFLQNAAGAARWEVTDEVEEEIRRAMWRAVPSDMARKRRLKTAEKFAGPHSDADGGRSKPAWKRKREEREAAGAGLPAPPPGGWKKKKKMKGKGGAAAAAPAGGDGGGAE